MKSKKSINKVTLSDVLEVTKTSFGNMEKKMDEGFKRVDGELKTIRETMATKDDISRIENVLLRAQDNRVTKLEDDMRKVKTHLTLD
jgi:hypothetical protein